MTHIDEHDWLDYIDGRLPDSQAATVDVHLAVCPDCVARLADLRAWRDALSTEGARLRQALETPQEDIERMLAESLARVHALQPATGLRSAHNALAALRALIDPIMGRGTVETAIRLALGRSKADLSLTTLPAWREFVANLSEAIGSVSGLAAARLVALAGVSLGDALLAGAASDR